MGRTGLEGLIIYSLALVSYALCEINVSSVYPFAFLIQRTRTANLSGTQGYSGRDRCYG